MAQLSKARFSGVSRPSPAFLLIAVIVAGCVKSSEDLASQGIVGPARECRGPSQAACYFRNSPVRLEERRVTIPGRSYDFFPLAEDLEFVDGQARKWLAPRQTLTDGASIPEVFVPIVGDPRAPEFTNAAALHDAYCGIGNEDGPVYRSRTWQETHRLFYDGLIVGGTPELKAKIMFAAVWLGGPRWYPKSGRDDLTMALLPKALMQQAMRDTRFYVNRRNPTFPQLLAYLSWQEERMKKLAYRGVSAPEPVMDDGESGGGEVISPGSAGGGYLPSIQP